MHPMGTALIDLEESHTLCCFNSCSLYKINNLELAIVPQMRALSDALSFAFPFLEVVLLAILLGLQNETLGFHHVEEQISHQTGVR